MAFLNVCWIYVLYLALTGIYRHDPHICARCVDCVAFDILCGNVCCRFPHRPIMIWDVLAVRTAMTVSGNYVFLIFQIRWCRRQKQQWSVRTFSLVFPGPFKAFKNEAGFKGFCIGTAALCFGFYNAVVPIHQLGINMWSVNETYNSCGYILSTALSFQYVVKKPPVEYSHSKLETIYEELLSEDEEDLYQSNEILSHKSRNSASEPWSALWMKAFLTCGWLEIFPQTRNIFHLSTALTQNTVKEISVCRCLVSMTSNSEFEFLTGDSVAMLPSNSIAYQFNVRWNTWSMVSTVRAQGYRAVAMHPYPGENWNRKTCYANMGFDEFWTGTFEGSEQLRYYTSDQGDFEKVIQAVEERKIPGISCLYLMLPCRTMAATREHLTSLTRRYGSQAIWKENIQKQISICLW